MENNLQICSIEGRAALNLFLTIPSSFSAELMSALDFDCVTVDMQHGMMDEAIAIEMLQAISSKKPTPFVRVAWNSPHLIMRALDSGGMGVICPMVSTHAEAQQLAEAAYYPPLGRRSMGATRGELHGGANYYSEANESISVIAMIETAEGVENAASISAVPGISGLYIGPNDLSVSLGLGRCQDPEHPMLLAAIEKIRLAARGEDKMVCIHAQSENAALEFVRQGFDMVTLGNDTRCLRGAMLDLLSRVRTAGAM